MRKRFKIPRERSSWQGWIPFWNISIYFGLFTHSVPHKLKSNSPMISLPNPPPGWKNDCHRFYPTTDINLITNPFMYTNHEWLASFFDAWLAQLIEYVYGIWMGAVNANDIVVVCYDAKRHQDSLRVNKDLSHLRFNVLLHMTSRVMGQKLGIEKSYASGYLFGLEDNIYK